MVLTTNRPERTSPGARLFAGDRLVVVASARPHRDHWIVAFDGITDREGAEALRGARIFGDPLESSGPEEMWVHDLIGSEVRDLQGRTHGRVRAIESNPAHDLLVLDDGGLVPCVFVVRQEPGLVIVDPPDGLLDLDR